MRDLERENRKKLKQLVGTHASSAMTYYYLSSAGSRVEQMIADARERDRQDVMQMLLRMGQRITGSCRHDS